MRATKLRLFPTYGLTFLYLANVLSVRWKFLSALASSVKPTLVSRLQKRLWFDGYLLCVVTNCCMLHEGRLNLITVWTHSFLHLSHHLVGECLSFFLQELTSFHIEVFLPVRLLHVVVRSWKPFVFQGKLLELDDSLQLWHSAVLNPVF